MMGGRIEFEAFLNWGPATKYTVLFSDVDGRHMDLDIASGQRYHVILEPVEPELKPCPHCGSDAEFIERPNKDGSRWYVMCNLCRAKSAEYADKVTAAKYWNRRLDANT